MADSCYLADAVEFCSLSPVTEAQAAELEAKKAGQLLALLVTLSGVIDTKLAQRGDVPFLHPYPHPIRICLADLVTPRFYEALEFRPTDEIQGRVLEREKAALDYLAEAGHPQKGLIVLPLQRGTTKQQPKECVTLAFSDVDPYAFRHRQYDAIRMNRGRW